MVAMPRPISTAPASSRRHGRLGRDTSHSAYAEAPIETASEYRVMPRS